MSGPSSATAWRHKRWARLRDMLGADTDVKTLNDESAPQTQPAKHPRSVVSGSAPELPTESAPHPPLPPSAPPANVASQLDDLVHLHIAFIQGMVTFSSFGRPLEFITDPVLDGSFVRWHIQSGEPCNSGKSSLDTRKSRNIPFLEYQNWLTVSYIFLTSSGAGADDEVTEYRQGLIAQILEELDRLEDLKEWEWERQATGRSESSGASGESRFTVNTERHLDAQWTSWTAPVTPVYAYFIVSTTSNLLLGMSRKATGVVMGGLRSTIRLTLEYVRAPGSLLPEDHRLLRQLARDPRTVLNALDLDPHVTTYNCCPDCFALYALADIVPRTCTERAAPESLPCGAKLSRRRKIGPDVMSIPVRKYLHQSLKHWLGRMLCRTEIETWLKKRRWNGGRATMPMTDAFDGIALQSLHGPEPGKAFLDGPLHEMRLVFALSADGFNPYQMKEAKHSVTSTAVYMICLNLPENLRYLPENLYLAGVIPGPTKPSTSQINHFLRLVMDELLDFWNPGVYYSQTALRPQGCLVRAALVPLVADLLAARQLSGLGPHNHARVLCSVCTTPADGVENTDPATFEPRDLEKHRADAKAWLDARTTFEREKLFQSTGVRYSELLRLPYWNPFLYTVVDTMHNLYLGILQRHIRVIWGISVDVEDGDASGNMVGTAPERPSDANMAAGVDLLLTATTVKLRTAGKAVLYHLCLDRGIRRAGTVSQLVKNLAAWRKKEGIHVEQYPAASVGANRDIQSELTPDYGKDDSAEIRSAEKTLQGPKASTALVRRRHDVLQTMCKVRGIECEDSTRKEVLSERLRAWLDVRHLELSLQQMTIGDEREQEATSLSPSSADPENATQRDEDPTVPRHRHDQEAIGRDTLSAYMEDRCRMQLPSWMNAPPVAFGTKQHGKLSADQWRALCIVNLPVTLIRTWSFQEERRVKMLENFLDVVEAVETFGLLEIGEKQIAAAEVLMRRYLEGVKDLYKGMKIQPNHHLALHIGIFLRLFGPVHSWRAFVFERFNFYLQSINTNMTFGELEMTFMMHSCRAANFQPFLRSPIVQQYMQDFSQQLQASDKKDRRGMRLDAVLRSAGEHVAASAELQGEPFKTSRPAPLGDPEYKALLQRLSYDDGNIYVDEDEFYAGRPAGRLPLPRSATRCSSLLVSGVSYKPWSRSLGDSNAMFRHPILGSNSHAGRIEQIFLHTRGAATGEDNIETFLVVKRLQPLNRFDAGLDPYRRYPTVGGRLYYSAYDDALFVIRGGDLVSHFASTSMEHLVVRAPGARDPTKTHPCLLSKRCVHVRPLDRLLREAHVLYRQVPDSAEGAP